MNRRTSQSAEWRSRSADSDKSRNPDTFVDDGAGSRQDRRFLADLLAGVLGGAGRTILRWRFFIGACLLTGALLLPHAKAGPVIAGMVLAGLMQIVWSRISGGRGWRR